VEQLLSVGYHRVEVQGDHTPGVVCVGTHACRPEIVTYRCLSEADLDRPSVIVLDGLTYGSLRITLSGSDNFIRVGAETALGDMHVICTEGSYVSLGYGTQSAGGAEIQARNGGSVDIGEGGLLAYAVRIMTDDMHEIYDLQTNEPVNGFAGRIRLGPRVWLGLESVLIGDLVIGADCVIGTRAVVTRDIPANTVAAGMPARVVRSGVAWRAVDSRSTG
jgi:acetyltransferase-like isoleucine patch superfamily enzyme